MIKNNLYCMVQKHQKMKITEDTKMNNYEIDNIITLNDESGIEVPFEFVDLISYSGNEYVVLLPIEHSDDGGDIVVLKVEDLSDGEETYVSVDDETLSAVLEVLKNKYISEFNFIASVSYTHLTLPTKA